MNVQRAMISTSVATTGMPIREFFAQCSRTGTPALPFCDAGGEIRGRVTLKNILRHSLLPDFMIELAMVLGDELSHMQDMGTETTRLLDSPVDPYVQAPHMTLTSHSLAIRALALMEQGDTSYLFIVDDDRYLGVVTIQSLAASLAIFDQSR